jgi:hypothetical protein
MDWFWVLALVFLPRWLDRFKSSVKRLCSKVAYWIDSADISIPYVYHSASLMSKRTLMSGMFVFTRTAAQLELDV